MKQDSTYNRKYYLIRKVKADGFELVKENNERKILIPNNRVNEAYCNPAISELSKLFQYGLQIVVTGTTPEANCKTVRVSFIHHLINKIKLLNRF